MPFRHTKMHMRFGYWKFCRCFVYFKSGNSYCCRRCCLHLQQLVRWVHCAGCLDLLLCVGPQREIYTNMTPEEIFLYKLHRLTQFSFSIKLILFCTDSRALTKNLPRPYFIVSCQINKLPCGMRINHFNYSVEQQ